MNVFVVPEELYQNMQRLILEILNPGEIKARLCALSLRLPVFDEINEGQVD